MNKKFLATILMLLFTSLAVAGCGLHQELESFEDNNNTSNTENNSSTNNSDYGSNDTTEENADTHEATSDYSFSSNEVIEIKLNGDSASSADSSVEIDDSSVTITSAGTYELNGELDSGQIIVDVDDDDVVKLVLNGVDIRSEENSPIYVKQADKVIVFLATGTDNTLADADEYKNIDEEDNEPNAAIYSKADLTIYGEDNSSLTVNGNYLDAIVSKDGLIVKNADITIEAADDGIRGKDYLVIENSDITINSGGDGLKSDNEEDTTKGYITVNNSSVTIDADADAVSASTDVLVANSDIDLTAGGGSSNSYNSDESLKGIKAGVDITIESGNIDINSADDNLHSNGTLVINGGTINLSSGDDGIHADTSITINGGDITIAKSYEGVESAVITINDGNLSITASDDGLNVAGGNDSSGFGRPGAGGFDAAEVGAYLYINGGYIYMNAGGDGLDSNGSVVMTGGTAIVNGPTNSGNGPLDYNGTFDISGGLLIAVGSSGMAQAPSQSSSQNSILVNFDSSQSTGTLINIQNEAGENILTFAPAKQYQSIAFSSPEITTGETYTISLGGEANGNNTDGLYSNETYSGGSEYVSLTISGTVTSSGSSSGMGGGMGQRGMRNSTSTDSATTGEMPTRPEGDFGEMGDRQMPNFEDEEMPQMPGEMTEPMDN